MSTDNYMKVTDIPGDSEADGHKDEIEINQWGFGANINVGSRSAKGQAKAKSNHGELQFSKELDSSSNDLASACWKGQVIPEVLIAVSKQGESGGGNVDYLKVTMKDAILSSYNINGGAGMLASDQGSWNFREIKFEFFKSDASGKGGGWKAKAWSVSEEKEV